MVPLLRCRRMPRAACRPQHFFHWLMALRVRKLRRQLIGAQKAQAIFKQVSLRDCFNALKRYTDQRKRAMAERLQASIQE